MSHGLRDLPPPAHTASHPGRGPAERRFPRSGAGAGHPLRLELRSLPLSRVITLLLVSPRAWPQQPHRSEAHPSPQHTTWAHLPLPALAQGWGPRESPLQTVHGTHRNEELRSHTVCGRGDGRWDRGRAGARCFGAPRRSQREEGLVLPCRRVSNRPFPVTAGSSAPPGGLSAPAATSTGSAPRARQVPGRVGTLGGSATPPRTGSQHVTCQLGALRRPRRLLRAPLLAWSLCFRPQERKPKPRAQAVPAWPPRAGCPWTVCSTGPGPPCEDLDALGTITVKPLGGAGSNGEGGWVWRSRRPKGGPERGARAGARERAGHLRSASAGEDRSGPRSAGSRPGPQPSEGAEPGPDPTVGASRQSQGEQSWHGASACRMAGG